MDQKILIDALKKLTTSKKEVNALPTRPRNLATDALNSDEISHLARHLIKITLWPESSYCKGWLKEIRTSLDNLAFKLCRYCVRKGSERVIKELWYDTSDIMRRLNEELDAAYWNVVDNMKSMIPEHDIFIAEEGNDFSKVGYDLILEKDSNGSLYFSLTLDGKRVV